MDSHWWQLCMSPGIVVLRIRIVWHVTVQYFGRMGVQMLLFVCISGMHANVELIPLFDFKQSKKLLNTSYPCHHPLIDVLNILHGYSVLGIDVLRRSLWFGWYRFDGVFCCFPIAYFTGTGATTTSIPSKSKFSTTTQIWLQCAFACIANQAKRSWFLIYV